VSRGEGSERGGEGEVRAIGNNSNQARARVEFELVVELEIGRDVPAKGG
jgi:hypothetical protein